jgi:hypothetical protein
MQSKINVIAAVGLALGGALGMAGALATQQNVQGILWAIDGAAADLCLSPAGSDLRRLDLDALAGKRQQIAHWLFFISLEIRAARRNVGFCEGFRMPARDGGGGELSGLRAGVRKPPKEEIAGGDT